MEISTQRILVLTATILSLFVTAFVVLTSNHAPQVDWSQDGDWIVFSCSNISLSDPQSFLYIVRPDGSSLQRISSSRFVALSPSWSPNGEWISFRSANRLLKMRPDGTDVETLVTLPPPEQLYSPVWSPNGEWIAYARNNLRGGEIVLFHMETSQQETVFQTDGLIVALTWSSDSEQIIFPLSSSLFTSGVYALTLDTRQTERLFYYQQIMGDMDLSRDNATLLIALFENRRPTLFLYDLNVNSLTSMDVPNFDGAPAWSTHGDWIAFGGYNRQSDEMQIYRMRANGENSQKITDLDGCVPSDPDWISFEPEQNTSERSAPF